MFVLLCCKVGHCVWHNFAYSFPYCGWSAIGYTFRPFMRSSSGLGFTRKIWKSSSPIRSVFKLTARLKLTLRNNSYNTMRSQCPHARTGEQLFHFSLQKHGLKMAAWTVETCSRLPNSCSKEINNRMCVRRTFIGYEAQLFVSGGL
jgi:hypothetical protein